MPLRVRRKGRLPSKRSTPQRQARTTSSGCQRFVRKRGRWGGRREQMEERIEKTVSKWDNRSPLRGSWKKPSSTTPKIIGINKVNDDRGLKSVNTMNSRWITLRNRTSKSIMQVYNVLSKGGPKSIGTTVRAKESCQQMFCARRTLGLYCDVKMRWWYLENGNFIRC